MLHLACRDGDQHFVTMLIYEASADGQKNNSKVSDMTTSDGSKFLDRMLHWKDTQGLTPVFHLCMRGFNNSDFKCKDDWLVFNTMLTHGIGTKINKDKLKNEIKKSSFVEP